MIDHKRMRHQIESNQSLEKELKLNADTITRTQFLESTERKGLLYDYEKQARTHLIYIAVS